LIGVELLDVYETNAYLLLVKVMSSNKYKEFNISELDYAERKELAGLLAKAGIKISLRFRDTGSLTDDCILVIYL